jgi:hypothetical protein
MQADSLQSVRLAASIDEYEPSMVQQMETSQNYHSKIQSQYEIEEDLPDEVLVLNPQVLK